MDDTPHPRPEHGTRLTSERAGPGQRDPQGLHRKWEKLTSDNERWRWHAYDRVWRKHMGFSLPSPCDPESQWASAELDMEAEKEWRREHPYAVEAERYMRPTWAPADRIRPEWRQIRGHDLTEAESALAQQEAAKLRARLPTQIVQRI